MTKAEMLSRLHKIHNEFCENPEDSFCGCSIGFLIADIFVKKEVCEKCDGDGRARVPISIFGSCPNCNGASAKK